MKLEVLVNNAMKNLDIIKKREQSMYQNSIGNWKEGLPYVKEYNEIQKVLELFKDMLKKGDFADETELQIKTNIEAILNKTSADIYVYKNEAGETVDFVVFKYSDDAATLTGVNVNFQLNEVAYCYATELKEAKTIENQSLVKIVDQSPCFDRPLLKIIMELSDGIEQAIKDASIVDIIQN